MDNFTIVNQQVQEDSYVITFGFTMASLSNVVGYKLYFSETEVSTKQLCAFIAKEGMSIEEDVTYTFTEDGVIHFNYTVPVSLYNKKGYFVVSVISNLWLETDFSSAIYCALLPDTITSLYCFYDNYDITCVWEDSINVLNTEHSLSHYLIEKSVGEAVKDYYINNDGDLASTNFFLGEHYLVIDYVKKSMWYGSCETSGIFALSDNTKFNYVFDQDVDYEVSINNISIFKESEFTELCFLAKNNLEYITNSNGTLISCTYKDLNVEKDKVYFYRVSGCSSTDFSGFKLYYPLVIKDLKKIQPYLRSIGNSENVYLANSFWKKLKNVLTDSNYYNKETFDIPELKGKYSFAGYIGISNVKVDIFLNDEYNQTVIPDFAGNFVFAIDISKNNVKLQMQARDNKNIGFSLKSSPQIIRPVNIYSFFTALGMEYEDIWKEILLQLKDFSFDTSRPQLLQDKLKPFLDFEKSVYETDTEFTNIIKECYLAYEYAGYVEGLKKVLEAFKANVTNFDHYDLFVKDITFNTKQTASSFVVRTLDLSSKMMDRKSYIYAITSVSDEGFETSPSVIRVDTRWWPTKDTLSSDDDYSSFIALTWDNVSGVNKYNIYRKEISSDTYSNDNFKLLTTAITNVFIDCGLFTETNSIPPLYNITAYTKPKNLRIIHNTQVTDIFLAKRSMQWIKIIVYEKENTSIASVHISRLKTLCEDLIPPELGYDIIVCNDSYSYLA